MNAGAEIEGGCPLQPYATLQVQIDHVPRWEVRGDDLVCDYCGSWNPDEFIEWCQTILDGKSLPTRDLSHLNLESISSMPVLEVSDRRNKIYVRRDGIRNASDGAIKVYVAHLTKDQIEVVNRTIRFCHEAVRAGRE